MHTYEVRPRKDHRGLDLISDVLPFGRLSYREPNAASNAIGYAKFFSGSHDVVIRLYDEGGNVIQTHEHEGNFKEPGVFTRSTYRVSTSHPLIHAICDPYSNRRLED